MAASVQGIVVQLQTDAVRRIEIFFLFKKYRTAASLAAQEY